MFENLREDLRRYGEGPRQRARALLLVPGVWAIVGYRFARELPELIAKTDIEPMYVELLARAPTCLLNVDETITAVEQSFVEPQVNSEVRRVVWSWIPLPNASKMPREVVFDWSSSAAQHVTQPQRSRPKSQL